MTDEYIAGFFDGEGCIVVRTRRRNGVRFVEVEVANVHRATLDTIAATLQAGSVKERTQRWRLGSKQQWLWRISRRADVIRVLNRLLPHLVQKRDRAVYALSVLEG